MKNRQEQEQERINNALLKILQSNAETEEEAIELIQQDVDLYNFSASIANIYRELEMLREEISEVRRDELSDILDSGCSCCCCGGRC